MSITTDTWVMCCAKLYNGYDRRQEFCSSTIIYGTTIIYMVHHPSKRCYAMHDCSAIYHHSSKSITPAKLFRVQNHAILVKISQLPACSSSVWMSFCLSVSFFIRLTLTSKCHIFQEAFPVPPKSEISLLCIPGKILKKICQALTCICYDWLLAYLLDYKLFGRQD